MTVGSFFFICLKSNEQNLLVLVSQQIIQDYDNQYEVLLICLCPQEHVVNGTRGVSVAPPKFAVLTGPYSLDRDGLKRLGIGLALAAAILAFILDKLY